LADKLLAEWNITGYDKSWLKNSQETINIIARSVEEYKSKYGVYPNSINDIRDTYINNEDFSYRIKYSNGKTRGIPFYYEKIDSSNFFLAGVGKDGIIKTEDDLLPQISIEQEKTTGLLKYVIKPFSKDELNREKKVINAFKWTKQEMQKSSKEK